MTKSKVVLAALLLTMACGSESAEDGDAIGGAAGSGTGGTAGNGAGGSGANGGVGGVAAGTGVGGNAAHGGQGLTAGCFDPGERPASVEPNGFAMPDLEAERAAYKRFGWTWSADAEPNAPAEASYSVTDPDIHGDTEADDLWTNLMMSIRTGKPGYADRAKAWARYFKEDYRSCVGGNYASFCYDREAFGADHLWGWGLLSWAKAQGDTAALGEAVKLGEVVEALWGPASDFSCLPKSGCTTYGVRQIGRHLLFITRLAEVTGDARWATLRDQIIDTLMASAEWDEAEGVYFLGEWSTDQILQPNAYAQGARIVSSFQIGVLSEAMDHAYRTTGREVLRTRLVAMARFVEKHGLDPEFDYTASTFGIVGGKTFHSYSAEKPVSFWDPVYTTSLVNTLMRGYRYTCEPHFFESAKHFFSRGNTGIYGEPLERAAPVGEVHHFVDAVFASASGNFYFDYNKGELQYTYLLFEPTDG
ncbi:MAG: hypothetical protein R3B13_15690 [Polyangiaceae bacterium]